MRFIVAFTAALALAAPVAAQQGASLDELARTPVVTVQIGETLRSPPDEATISVGTTERAPTASAALAQNKQKTEALIAAIRSAGIAQKDIQTQGLSLNPDYRYERVGDRSEQRFNGYIAANNVRVKTRNIARLSALLDTLATAGADRVYGPTFSLADPLPLRREARKRAMARGEAEAMEYAANAGFARVRLLSVQEGVSARSSDAIIVTGSRIASGDVPPPPAPPPPPVDGGGIEGGQITTSVTLTLVYRMER